ncbi:transketolase [Carboxydochorda subterranea]|uniref:Transketolase n=1 Tax=Carboxydichorda subterranea TaxID=3109565 RepID=A0ABZ1C1G3_9FIRM|nr:transketolase [Limnochorda sp. L945t]WRP18631.1 transketolase [Limnochorda sp. L945t]
MHVISSTVSSVDDAILSKVADTVRVLAVDAIEAARSGHPGLPLGCAEIGAVLFGEWLRHDPAWPAWPDRDRFVLSAGHGSMLLYSLLHLSGYALGLEELRRFRQLHSLTPGHPEYGLTPGVETTTGPLGQGFGNAVGMALVEAMLARRFNRPGLAVVDHRTWVLAGDGDLMEGVSSEAASLAGHLRLGKLIVIYDQNRISIEGTTELAFTEDVAKRFEAYGWHVAAVDGHDLGALRAAIRWAVSDVSAPKLIVARTHIAYKSEKQDQAEAHGAPLGREAVAALKRRLGWDPDRAFEVPAEVYRYFDERRKAWRKQAETWQRLWEQWSASHPELRRQWDEAWSLEVPEDLVEALPAFVEQKPVSTRVAGGKVLNAVAERLPYLVGGSADLAPSTRTYLDGKGSVQAGQFEGRNLHFGVREHAMGAILNGMALHGGVRPFGSTFLVFSDYMRPPIRLAAMMRLPVLFVFTHDSVWVGEDGPTHQPVEHLDALRAIPQLEVWRPADARETAAAYLAAIERRDGPSALVLTRQDVPVLPLEGPDGATRQRQGVKEGAYVLWEAGGGPVDVTLVATGSEVSLALDAARSAQAEGIRARVVSVPCRERFIAMPPERRERLLAAPAPRVIVEAGVRAGWGWLAGPAGRFVGVERFGLSAPAAQAAQEVGLTKERVLAAVREAAGKQAG